MSNLNCSARHCDHNLEGICKASNILIEGVSSTYSGDTYCSTYVDEDGEIGLTSGINDSYMASMIQGFTSSSYDMNMSPHINCNAVNCIYNLYGTCHARDVVVNGEDNGVLGTMCSTFIHK